jgi:hypothetical protein
MAFAPTDITGCQLWLDADDLSTFTFGTAPAVSQWNDKSGNSRHVTQATGSKQPTRNAPIGGKIGLRFVNASAQELKYGSGSLAQPYTFCAVAALTGAGSANARILSHRDNADVQFLIGDSANVSLWANGGFVTQGSVPAAGRPQVLTGIGNGTSSQVWANGTAGTAGNAGTSALNYITIGARGGGVAYLDGEIAEVIVYDTALGSTDRATVEAYLTDKWVNQSFGFAPGAQVVATGAFTSSGSISSTNVPVGAHLAHDIVAIAVGIDTDSGTIDTPSGWTAVGNASTTSNITSRMFWARAASDNQFGSTVNVTHSAFRRTSAVSTVVRGGSTTVDPYGAKGTTTTDLTKSPALTITGSRTLLVAAILYRTGGLTWPMSDSDWADDNSADGGGTNTGGRVGHRTSYLQAMSYPGETLWDGSSFNNADCWALAVESAPIAPVNPVVPVMRGRRR